MRRSAVVTLLVLAVGLLASWLLDETPPPPDATPSSQERIDTDAASAHAAEAALAITAGLDGGLRGDGARTANATFDPWLAVRSGYQGRVVTHTGTAVKGMRVRLFRGAPDVLLLAGVDAFSSAPPQPQLEAARATTDDDGRFRLDGIAVRGICWLRIEWPDLAAAPPHLRAGDGTVLAVQRTPQAGEVIDIGDVVLKQGATLRGRVVDERGDPIVRATVRAMRLPNLPFSMFPIERLSPDDAILVTGNGLDAVVELPPWAATVEAALPLCKTATAADGTFALHGVDEGQNVVAVTHADHLGVLKQGVVVKAAEQRDLGEIALQDGEETTVTVLEPSGKPVADAEVLVAGESLGIPVHLGERAGKTSADGTLSVRAMPRGRALAAARRSPREPWILGESASSGSPLTVVLPAHHALVLRVLLPDGTPCKEPKLQLARGNRDQMAVELQMLGARSQLELPRRTQRLDDGRVRIDDVPAGPWTLLATSKGCGVESQQLTVTSDVEIEVRLRAARTAVVVVTDAAGEPVEGASLFVQPRGGSRAQRILELPTHAGTTDQNGRCTLRDLPTDQTKVTAEHPLHGQVHKDVAGVPERIDLQFLAAGSITGTLTDGGRPPAPGRWVAVLERRYDKDRPRGAMPDLPQLQLPGLDGSFSFGALQPGMWRVTVQDSLTDASTVGGIYDYMARRKQIFPWSKAEVVLHSGETLSVRIDAMLDAEVFTGPGAEVRGMVTIDGMPAEGALVVGTSPTKPAERRTTSRVDRTGAFDLGRCPEGALRVVVVPKDVAESRLLENLWSHNFARDLVVENERAIEMQIDLATFAAFGEVRDAGGRPVADCRVVLHDSGGEGRSSALRSTRTDQSGSFRVDQLAFGRYVVQAEKDSVGRGRTEFGNEGAREFGPIAIELTALGRVRGRVDPKALENGRGTILLVAVSGSNTARTSVDRSGRFDVRNVPLGSYRVLLQTGAETASPVEIGVCDVVSSEPVELRTRLDPR